MGKRKQRVMGGEMAGGMVPVIPQDPSAPAAVAALKGIAFWYAGVGWARGIPARNLTVEEAERFGRERIRGIMDMHTGERMYIELDGNS